MLASHAAPAGDLAHNPGMCPDWELNQQPFGSQAGAQPTESHQPALIVLLVSEESVVLFFLIPDIGNLSSLPTPLSLPRGLSVQLISQTTSFWFHRFFSFFSFLFYFVHFCSDLYCFLASALCFITFLFLVSYLCFYNIGILVL